VFIQKRNRSGCDYDYDKWLTWLEKQGQTFTQKDVDDAWLKGMCDAKHELEKQGEQNLVYCDKDELMHKLAQIIAFWANRHGCSVYEENDLLDFVKVRQTEIIKLFNPNACLVDLSDCTEEYRKAYYDGYNKCSHEMIKVKDYLEKQWDKPQGKPANVLSNQSNVSNGVWHTADETPVAPSDRQILVLFKNGDAMVSLVEDWENLDNQGKWAYIKDLTK